MSGSPSADPDVIWEGSPSVGPWLAAVTIEAVLLSFALAYVELAALKVGSSFVGATLLLVALLWLVGTTRLELLRRSNHYTLRGSSLEIRSGILAKKIFTVSAAGFSDVEVTQSLAGRILDIGDIVIESNSKRDLRLVRISDPIEVSTVIRKVMTVPFVRVAGEGSLMASGGGMAR